MIKKRDKTCGVVVGYCTKTMHWHTKQLQSAKFSLKTNTDA